MKIYVHLINEGTNVWRPVEAERNGDLYRIIGKQQDETEEWEFGSGDLVRCEERQFQIGTKGLVAVQKMQSTRMLQLSDKSGMGVGPNYLFGVNYHRQRRRLENAYLEGTLINVSS